MNKILWINSQDIVTLTLISWSLPYMAGSVALIAQGQNFHRDKILFSLKNVSNNKFWHLRPNFNFSISHKTPHKWSHVIMNMVTEKVNPLLHQFHKLLFDTFSWSISGIARNYKLLKEGEKRPPRVESNRLLQEYVFFFGEGVGGSDH